MTDLRLAATQALELIEKGDILCAVKASHVLRAALAQPDVPEGWVLVPVAWMYTDRFGEKQAFTTEPPPSFKASCQALYTHPPARVLTASTLVFDAPMPPEVASWLSKHPPATMSPPARVPLTKAQVLDLWERTYVQRGTSGLEFARAIERAHGIGGGK